MADRYTEDEAVAELRRLAKRWPDTLMMFGWSGTLAVFPRSNMGDPIDGDGLHIIHGIFCDGGDPDVINQEQIEYG